MAPFLAPAAFATIQFDYLIVGGGTAGLTVATRLSENADHTIGVIEAGGDQTEDPLILTPGLATSAANNPLYDWSFETTHQVHANGRAIGHPRGRQLGGSSAINYLYWTHASQLDIDDWGKLGNKGWSWNELQPYYLKSESYNPPTAEISSQIDTTYIQPSVHGTSGPLQSTFPPFFDDFFTSWVPTYESVGLGPTSDPRDGLGIGGYSTIVSAAAQNASRSYSANAYWKPNRGRPNLHVLVKAHATKIVFDPQAKPLRATGVTFIADNETYTAQARGEVIASAGTFQSPQLLELSGIGRSELLKRLDIGVLLENAKVGENMQDHLLVPLAFEVAPGEFTFESFRDPAVVAAASLEYTTNHTGPLASNTCNAYISFAQVQEALEGEYSSASGSILDKATRNIASLQDKLTLAKLLSPTEASFQEVYQPVGSTPSKAENSSAIFSTDQPGNYFTIFSALEHPFSRGSVHITSSSALDYPAIDPNYLAHSLDLDVISQGVLHIQKIARTKPLASHLKDGGTVYQPGFHELDESNVEDFVRANAASEWHPIGTCAMLPLSAGGVVDERMRVYGTENLRVVDASIFPLQVRGNLQTLVYAVAERAADFVKEDARV